MISDEEKARLRFELANANMQSIGRAQGLYLTALLTFICLVWGLFFVGSNEVSLHIGPFDLKVDGIWRITPFVLLVLTLAYVGTLTAAVPAFAHLRDSEKELFGAQEHSFSGFDVHKNLIDYIAILQLLPWGNTRAPTDNEGDTVGRRLRHLILPALFVGSAFTSAWAVYKSYRLGSSHHVSLALGAFFLVIQILFSIRPTWRFVGRFLGANRTSSVFN